MIFKLILTVVLIGGVLVGEDGLGIGVKDKKAIKAEVAKLAAKLTELESFYRKFEHHRDNIREGFLHDSIFKLKGLAKDQIDDAFSKFDDVQDHLDRLKESIFAADPKNREKWTKVLDSVRIVYKVYPELDVFREQTLQGDWQRGMERVMLDRKEFLLQQLERTQELAKDLRNLKKINEERINSYQKMHEQLKEWSQATPETWEGPFNQPMPKSKLMWVIIETKKEIVTLKRSIFNILKLVTDEELRKELMYMEEVKHVF